MKNKSSHIHEIYYVSSNEGKFFEVTRFLNEYAPFIKLHHHKLELDELQSLDEKEVLRHKAEQAWCKLQKPLLIDDAGCYFHAYPRFPGTISKPVFDSLGHEGLYKLAAEDNRVEFYVGMVYVDEQGAMHYFRGSTQGYYVSKPDVPAPYSFGFYRYFQPEGLSLTYAQLWNDPTAWKYFGRVKAARQFADWLKTTL